MPLEKLFGNASQASNSSRCENIYLGSGVDSVDSSTGVQTLRGLHLAGSSSHPRQRLRDDFLEAIRRVNKSRMPSILSRIISACHASRSQTAPSSDTPVAPQPAPVVIEDQSRAIQCLVEADFLCAVCCDLLFKPVVVCAFSSTTDTCETCPRTGAHYYTLQHTRAIPNWSNASLIADLWTATITQMVAMQARCGHDFCQECYRRCKTHAQSLCPLCRKPFSRR